MIKNEYKKYKNLIIEIDDGKAVCPHCKALIENTRTMFTQRGDVEVVDDRPVREFKFTVGDDLIKGVIMARNFEHMIKQMENIGFLPSTESDGITQYQRITYEKGIYEREMGGS